MREWSHQDTADLFDGVWRSDAYAGFSEGKGEAGGTTPLLEAFISAVKHLPQEGRNVVEFGAGSGEHAIRLAQAHLPVTAVEWSPWAVERMQHRFASRIAGGVQFPQVVRANMFGYLQEQEGKGLDNVYANSVLHCLSAQERAKFFELLAKSQRHGKFAALSFKASGDALQESGEFVETTPAGDVLKGGDGIRRLFVADPMPIIREAQRFGLRVNSTLGWEVPDYNLRGKTGRFVGFLAEKQV